MAAPLHILDEHRITLDETRFEMGSTDKPVDYSSVFRAVTVGILISGGVRIQLEALKTGGKWITSKEAVGRYLARLTEASLGRFEKTALSSNKQRQQEIGRAARECEAMAAV